MSRDLPRHIASAIDAAPHVLRETDALREIAMSPRTQRLHKWLKEFCQDDPSMLQKERNRYWDRPIATVVREAS